MDILKGKKLILGSKSSRRQQLLEELDLDFEVNVIEIEENYPDNLGVEKVAGYLSQLKSNSYHPSENEIILTADTIVIYRDVILGKPNGIHEAREMLKLLSGNTHKVITGFTLKTMDELYTESIVSSVKLLNLSMDEIDYYINKFHPMDKAGSYGIQEWLGYAKIEKIEGTFANIMGLPTHSVYKALLNISNKL